MKHARPYTVNGRGLVNVVEQYICKSPYFPECGNIGRHVGEEYKSWDIMSQMYKLMVRLLLKYCMRVLFSIGYYDTIGRT